jgi:hypothetical protein
MPDKYGSPEYDLHGFTDGESWVAAELLAYSLILSFNRSPISKAA